MSVNRSFYYIYKVMKYRKILIKYNAYFEEAVFHIRVNIKSRISHVKKQDFIFSLYRNRKLGTTFFLFLSIWSKGSNSILHNSFFF